MIKIKITTADLCVEFDYEGSTRIKAYINDPMMIAQLAEVARGRLVNQVSQAEYLKDKE